MKVKFLLKDSEIPKTWYNVMADMPNPPAAVLHPGTGKPVSPDDLVPALPHAPDRAGSVVAAGDPDPRGGPGHLHPLEADTDVPRPPPRGGAGDEVEDLLQVRGRQPRGKPQAEHLHPPGVLQQDGGTEKDRHRDGGRAVGLRHGPRRLVLRPRGEGVHGEGQLQPEAVPPHAHGNLGGEGRGVPQQGHQLRTRHPCRGSRTPPGPSASRSARR